MHFFGCSEKEIDDVLQTTAVFSNVSKGVLAKHEDLVDVFGTDNEEKICQIILQEGDYQVLPSENPREALSLNSTHSWQNRSLILGTITLLAIMKPCMSTQSDKGMIFSVF